MAVTPKDFDAQFISTTSLACLSQHDSHRHNIHCLGN
jgi:hypothetical protein